MKKYNVSSNLITMLIVFISLGFHLNLEAQDKRVSLKDRREGILSSAEKFLNPGNPELLKRFEEVWNPFEPYVEPTIEPDPEPVTATQPKQINEKLILMQVVRLLKPKGSLILGENRILILEDRKKLREGDIIPAKIGGVTYKVQITEITGRNFSLSLNQTKLTSGFSKASSKGKVTRNKARN
jgi:hypothetical protein